MTKDEIKEWFFRDSPNLISLWSELEISTQGTSEFKDYVEQHNIRTNLEWAKEEKSKNLSLSKNKSYLESKCTLINYSDGITPQDFDGGIMSPLGKPWRRRYVFLNNDWYTVCDQHGVMTVDFVLSQRSDFNSFSENLKAKDLIKSGWRMKGV